MVAFNFWRRTWRWDPLILSQLICGANPNEIADIEERNGRLHGRAQHSTGVGFEPSSIASQFGGDVMNKKLLKEKWSYTTLASFSKSFSEPCISEMIYLFYIFWDRRINVIFPYLFQQFSFITRVHFISVKLQRSKMSVFSSKSQWIFVGISRNNESFKI